MKVLYRVADYAVALTIGAAVAIILAAGDGAYLTVVP